MASTRDAKYLFTEQQADTYLNGAVGKVSREFRNTNSRIRSKSVRHSEIAKLDPEKSLPVIIQILIEINQKIPQLPNNNNQPADAGPFPIATNTKDVVISGLQSFYEIDVLQNMGISSVPGYFKSKNMPPREFIEGMLKSMVESIKHVEISDATLALWEECAIWLDGIYHRTYDRIKKDTDGQPKRDGESYVTVDMLDWTFKKATGLTKMGISMFYHEAAELVEGKIVQFREAQRVSLLSSKEKQEDQHVAQSLAATEEDGVEHEMQGSVRNNVCLHKNRNGTFTFELTVAETDADILQDVCETINSMMNNPLQTQLREDMHASVDVRLQNFESKLKKYGLSASQKLLLENFSAVAVSKLEKYPNSAPLRSFLGRYVTSYADLVHKDKVEETIKALHAEKDPLEQLFVVLDLHQYLDKNNSTTVLPIVRELLLVQIDRLCPRVESKLFSFDSQDNARKSSADLHAMLEQQRPDLMRTVSVPSFANK